MIEAIASHLDSIAALAPVWGLPLIFVFMAIESSFIPFPSEVVMIPAGFLAARGELGLGSPAAAASAAVAAGVAGSLAGAYVNYFIALKVGKPFLVKYGKWFFLTPAALDRACEVFNRYGAATTFVCRMIPAIRQLISIPAGIARMPLAPFTLFTAFGAGVWTVILALVGYALGKSAGDISYLELCMRGKEMASSHLPIAIGVAVVLAALYMLAGRLAMGKGRKTAAIVLALASIALSSHGALSELRQGGFVVKFITCPDCPMRARFAPDAVTAFVNTSKVADDGSRERMAERLFGLMKMANEAKKAGQGKPEGFDIAKLCQDAGADERDAHALLANPYVLAAAAGNGGCRSFVRDGKSYALVADAVGLGTGVARFVAICNATESPRVFKIGFASLGLAGRVEIADLGERTDIGAFKDACDASVPPHSVKFYRLDAEKAAERQ